MRNLLVQLLKNRLISGLFKGQFLIFILVGIGNTIFGYLVYFFLIFLGLPYMWVVFVTTCLGVLFNFMTTGRLVFKNKNNKLILNFILVYVIIYFLTVGLIKILNIFIPNLYLDGAIAAACMPIISFILFKILVFRGGFNEAY